MRSYISLLAEAVGVRQEDKFKKYVNFATVDEVVADTRECFEAGGYTTGEMELVLTDYFGRLCPRHGRQCGQ